MERVQIQKGVIQTLEIQIQITLEIFEIPQECGTIPLQVLDSNKCVWRGNVPTNTNTPLQIYPSESKILHEGFVMPNLNNSNTKVWKIVIFVMVICALLFIIYKTSKKKKRK